VVDVSKVNAISPIHTAYTKGGQWQASP
jgi:hypothetical protein